MNKQEFLNYIVSEANNFYTNPTVTNETECGEDFCVITTDGVLKYFSFGDKLMNSIFHKFVDPLEFPTYDFRPFIVPLNNIDTVKFVEKVEESVVPEDFVVSNLDTLEVLVDSNDSSKYVILSDGEIKFDTMGIKLGVDNDIGKCTFTYNSSKLSVQF